MVPCNLPCAILSIRTRVLYSCQCKPGLELVETRTNGSLAAELLESVSQPVAHRTRTWLIGSIAGQSCVGAWLVECDCNMSLAGLRVRWETKSRQNSTSDNRGLECVWSLRDREDEEEGHLARRIGHGNSYIVTGRSQIFTTSKRINPL